MQPNNFITSSQENSKLFSIVDTSSTRDSFRTARTSDPNVHLSRTSTEFFDAPNVNSQLLFACEEEQHEDDDDGRAKEPPDPGEQKHDDDRAKEPPDPGEPCSFKMTLLDEVDFIKENTVFIIAVGCLDNNLW